MTKLETPPITFQGDMFRKVLGVEPFYFNKLLFPGEISEAIVPQNK